ncbi:MAG: hypothetical protein V1678_00185 [Candidatus Aenigmatarchaeota archaeon]
MVYQLRDIGLKGEALRINGVSLQNLQKVKSMLGHNDCYVLGVEPAIGFDGKETFNIDAASKAPYIAQRVGRVIKKVEYGDYKIFNPREDELTREKLRAYIY